MIVGAAWTHVGRVRSRNEDVVVLPGILLTGSPVSPVGFSITDDDVAAGGRAIAVVDGMGGHAGGQHAARLAGLPLTGLVTDPVALRHEVHDGLYDEMRCKPELTAMGATIAGVALAADTVVAFNVGDARAYVQTDGFSSLLSVDDRRDDGSNVLTAALGGTSKRVGLDVHVRTVEVVAGDRFLLCSDGLWEVVSFQAIQTELGSGGTALDAVHRLVDAAVDAGAPDNVSVVVFDVVDIPPEVAPIADPYVVDAPLPDSPLAGVPRLPPPGGEPWSVR